MATAPQSKLITDLGHDIYLLDADYIRPSMAAVYLLVQNQQITVIETGTAYTVPGILGAIKQLGFETTDVAYIIPTHAHLDHAGGAGLLMQQCTNAHLVIHPRGARHMIDPTRLIEGTQAVYGKEKFHALYGELIPVNANRVIEAPDNHEINLHGRTLTFIDTPGHARHHFCIHDAVSQGIFSGDTFGLCYRELDTHDGPFIFATTTPVQFEPEELLHSIDRLLSLKPTCLYLTHYGSIEPTDSIVQQLKSSVKSFAQIALEEQFPLENRLARLEKRLMAYLLDLLDSMRCFASQDECRAILMTDVQLNAQGLDVWLNRR